MLYEGTFVAGPQSQNLQGGGGVPATQPASSQSSTQFAPAGGQGTGGQPTQEDLALQRALALSEETAAQETMVRAHVQSQPSGAGMDGDAQLQAAIAASMQDGRHNDPAYEPMPADQRLREDNQPAGLRNIGNTCYFNSLLQVYYSIPEFVIQILDFKDDEPVGQDVEMTQEQSGTGDAHNQKLVKSGKQLIHELKKLFAAMSMGNKKYVDPSGVLKSIVNDQGEPMTIGEEKDIREFNDVLLSRIRNAFDSRKQEQEESKERPMQVDDEKPVQPEPDKLETPELMQKQSSFMDVGDEHPMIATGKDARMESQQEVEKEGEIDSTFIGKVKQLLEFKDKQDHLQQRELFETFNDIMLQIADEKDFYKAWEGAFSDTIQGYEVDETTKSDAKKTEWIVKLPEVMTFQMNRLKFQDGRVLKMNHELPIQQEIHPDRFMLENRDEVEKLRKRVKVLRDKIKYLEECLARYTNYNGSGTQITAAFDQVFHFFNNLNTETPPETELEASEMSDVKTFLPLNQNIHAENMQQIAQLLPKIEEMRKATALQVEQLEKQIAAQQTNLNNMYKHLSKKNYQLHAVCIHDGSAESGHYYTLIKDHNQNVWREFNDIRVKVVDEETVLNQSKGGEGYKSAYWLVYISDKMLNQYKQINYNQYDHADMQKNCANHVYGQRIQQDRSLYDEQLKANQKLVAEVDEFKNSEAANKVTALYDKRTEELKKIFEPPQDKDKEQKPTTNQELANFYASLYKQEAFKDTAKRLLLDQCFFETQGTKRQEAERSEGILAKIVEKGQGRPMYPQGAAEGDIFMREQDQMIVINQMETYQELFLTQFIQCQVFEKFIEGDYVQAIAFAEWRMKRKQDIFETDLIQKPEHKKEKMLYDSVRIITLRMCTFINECLIRLHQNPDLAEVKQKLVQTAITLLAGTKLFYNGDKHIAANLHNLTYSFNNFQDILTKQQLTNDFQKMLTELNEVVEKNKKDAFDNSTLEHEQDFSTRISEANMQEIDAIQSRDWMTWTAIEGSLMTRFTKANTDFREQFGNWIKWHMAVIQERGNLQHNEKFELNVKVNVCDRTLPPPAESDTA